MSLHLAFFFQHLHCVQHCVMLNLCANDVLMSKRATFFLKVHDKRDEEFIFRLPWDRFPGEGKAVSSQLPGLSCKHHSVTPKKFNL